MEEEAMASEGNASLVHEENHLSLYTNGQVGSEQANTFEQQQNIVEVTVTNKLREDSPTVVVKKTVSLRMQSTIVNGVPVKSTESVEESVAAEMEKVPILLPMKGPENTAVALDDEQLIEESELIAVEKTPVSLQMELTFDSGVAEGNEEEEILGETSVSEQGAGDVPDSHEGEKVLNSNGVGNHTEDEKALDRGDPIEESSPIVIEKRPASLHVEQVLHEGSFGVQEPIEEASAVAVESEPRVCDYHPMLEETVEGENVDGNCVEVEYEPATTTHENEEQTVEMTAEESPLVVEKRPVSLHMEAAFDHKEEEEVRTPIEEAPLEIIDKRPVLLHMDQIFNGEGGVEVQEPIEEASAVAVESEPRVCDYHPMLEETEEEEDVDGNTVEVEYESAATKPRSEEEMETETKETITEESPLVVKKRPVSLHMEAAFDHKEDEERREPIEETPHEIIEKRPVSLHMDQIFSEEGNNEVQEPIEEASAVAVEFEPRVCDYHPMLEETVADENVEGNTVEVEYEPAAMISGNKDEVDTETKETITEESPLVVEKRPVSLHMKAVDHKEDEEVRKPVEEAPYEIIEKRPVSLHLEQMFNEEGNNEVQEPIEEASVVAVESEPRLFDYHPMLEERAEDENVHGNSVEAEYEPVASKADTKEETKTETGPRETVAEESPLVVEKRPVGRHIEAAFDQKEDAKEPIEEEVCDYHPMLEETVEDENVHGNCVEVEYEPAATTLENQEETVSETKKVIAEESPFVVEKRPASLHLETVFVHKEEGEVKEPIEEASIEIIEKRPVSLHMEQMFNEEGGVEVQEPIEEACAVAVESEPKVCDYHPMLEETREDENVGGNSVEVEYEPATMKLDFEGEKETEGMDAITEESPLVVEKRPASLHMEAVFKPKEEVKEPIEEVPQEIIEKRPVSLRMEQVFNEEGSNEVQEPREEVSAVAGETEPRLFHYHPMLEEKVEDKNVDTKSVEVEYEPAATKREREEETKTDTSETITEESPLVVEKQPASLHLEVVIDHEKGPEVGKPVEETPPIVVEKTPIDNSRENESVAEEEPSSVHVLDIPEVEKVKEVEDSVQEAVASAVERKAPEFHYELLQTVETEDEKPDDTTVEVKVEGNQVRETEILDDEVQVPELKGNEVKESKRSEVITKTEVISTVTINQRTGDETTQEMETNVVQTTYEKKTVEYSNTSTTGEACASTSFTKLNQHGRDDDEELLRHVLRKRLSAPEVLPEKENDGSAPLAASEDRGILESQEQFTFVDNSRKKDWTPINKPQVSVATPSETEPYEDVADEKKLIADSPGEANVAVGDSVEKEDRSGESLPVLLLLAPEEEKGDHENEQKKGKASGPSSPQCKCCSLL